MDMMTMKDISPDQVVLFNPGGIELNATIVYTWVVMLLLVAFSWLVTRKFGTTKKISRSQNLLEIIVTQMRSEIRDISGGKSAPYLPFVGTLFLFILLSNILSVVPGFVSPTASLSTTAALAICVFIAVPVYGIISTGLGAYLKQYLQPTPFMLPFNIMGELSRTLALAVRLFGNMMSGMKIIAILISLAPLFFPVIMHVMGLLTGVIQAYIFAVLAMVYIASAARVQQNKEEKEAAENDNS